MRRHEIHPRTVIINKEQKNQSKQAKHVALTWLATTFPPAFDNTLRIRPLKNGIINDILQHADEAKALGISRSKIREAVVLFTRRLDYLICLKAKEMRIDLAGNPVEVVTEEEAQHAALKIKKRIEKSTRNANKITVMNHKSPNDDLKQASKFNYYASNELANDRHSTLHYFERSVRTSAATSVSSTNKPTIIVKSRTTRQYDTNAIARLKEKLGRARKEE